MDDAREQWAATCAAFTREHRGWLCALELDDGRTMAQDLPLENVHFEAEANEFVITLGSGAQALTQRVPQPSALHIEHADDQRHLGLRIESENGHATRLRFRAAALPEELDGITDMRL